MRIILLISRLIVGSLFLVSGLIKANDPLGFSYKLGEYFAESALGLPGLEPFALLLGILACVAEIVLGFAVLVGGRMRLATTSLLVLTIFFGWLTAFTGRCNDLADAGTPMTYTIVVDGQEEVRDRTCVSDCGCFGDAMKGSVGRSLTPWESFAKDAILFVFILPLFVQAWRGGIRWNSTADDLVLLPFGLALVAVWSWIFTWWGPVWFTLVGFLGYLVIKRLLKGQKAEWATAIWAALLTLALIFWCIAHLPVRDYRPYAIGNSIPEQSALAKPPVEQIFMRYRHKPSGEVKEYDVNGTYPWDDADYEYVDRRIVELEPGVDSQVKDFVLTDVDGNDITADLLAETQPVLLVMVYNVETTATGNLPKIAKLAEEANRNGWFVYAVSASPFASFDALRHEHGLAMDMLQCDEKTIKTVVRANPGIVLMKEGTVMGKWHANDTPTLEEAQQRLSE